MPDGVARICWPHGGTLGLITVAIPRIHGMFPAGQGDNATVCCSISPAGKYRNGAARVGPHAPALLGGKADHAALAASGVQRCASHAAPLGYVCDPLVLEVADPNVHSHTML